ncbi:MAG: leucine-rich repeat domain-containing protein [Prevotella sp.]|nr:leucine-rich repeat domain-containing protein [Prevotella sp.]
MKRLPIIISTMLFVAASIMAQNQKQFIVADKNGNSPLVQSLIFQQQDVNERFSWKTEGEGDGYQANRDIKDLLFIARANAELATASNEDITKMLEDLCGTDEADANAVAAALQNNPNIVEAFSPDGGNVVVRLKDNGAYVVYPMYSLRELFSEDVSSVNLSRLLSMSVQMKKAESQGKNGTIAIFNYFDGFDEWYKNQNAIIYALRDLFKIHGYDVEYYGDGSNGLFFSENNLRQVVRRSADYKAIIIMSHGAGDHNVNFRSAPLLPGQTRHKIATRELCNGVGGFPRPVYIGTPDDPHYYIQEEADDKYYCLMDCELEVTGDCILYDGSCFSAPTKGFSINDKEYPNVSKSVVLGWNGINSMSQAHATILFYRMLTEKWTLLDAIAVTFKKDELYPDFYLEDADPVTDRSDRNHSKLFYSKHVSKQQLLGNKKNYPLNASVALSTSGDRMVKKSKDKEKLLIEGEIYGNLSNNGFLKIELKPIYGTRCDDSYFYPEILPKENNTGHYKFEQKVTLKTEGIYDVTIWNYDDSSKKWQLLPLDHPQAVIYSNSFRQNCALPSYPLEDTKTPAILDDSGEPLDSIYMSVGCNKTFAIDYYEGHSLRIASLYSDIVTISLSDKALTVNTLAEGYSYIGIYDEKNKQLGVVKVIVTAGGDTPNPGGDITAYTSCPDDHHPHLIDLGLPSGTKWACCNVGASRPEDYGSYYAWGETEEKDDYDGSVIINSILFDLEIGTNFSGTQFDVAHVKWGSVWVLPNFDQLRELICNTTSEWTIQNGVNGRIFTGNNGGTVFLPAAGVSPSYYVSNDTFGNYYSSSYYGNQNYHGIGFDYEKVYQWSGCTYCGYVVRPVASSSGSTSDPDNPNPNNPDDSIINFADPAVANICIERWDTNGDGELSKDEAAAVTDLGEVFKENEEITSFDELQYFTGLSSIGKRAFFACTGLATIRIPNSVKIIDTYSFQSCKSLVSVTIPKGVTSIASGAFWNCTSLTSIDVDEGNSVYVSENGILFDKNLTTIMCYPNGKPENTYIIPNSVAIIGDWAFTESYNLTTIIIPESVISIGKYAFAHCYELTSIIIGNSVASIGENAFQQCNNLNSLTIPSSVTKIERCAFEFCDNLSEVISYINEPFTINNNVFLLTDRTHYSNAILYVPAGTKAKYEATEGWKNFKNIVEMGGDDDPVSQQEIDKLNAELDNLIAQIRDVWGKLYNKTFGEEKRFTADIYGKLSEVSMRLQQCRTMLSVVKTQKEMESLKAEVASMAELLSTAAQQTEAFSLSFGDTFVATSAEGIELKFTVLNAQEKTCLVGDMSQQHSHSALTNIDQTGSVTVPATVNYKGETYKVTEIGPGAFSSCRLSFINIPSVSHIWMNAFWYSQITEITIPESVTGMGPQIFSSCSQLKKVICLIKEPIVLNQRPLFDGIPADATLYVPAGTKAKYEATEEWNIFKNIVEME